MATNHVRFQKYLFFESIARDFVENRFEGM